MREYPAFCHSDRSGGISYYFRKTMERCLVAAITHVSPNLFQEFIQRSRSVPKHRHLLARLGHVRRQKNIFASRNFFTAPIQVRRRGKGRVWSESPTFC